MYVPSKLIIFVSTIVSTGISLLAGYLLYVESISVLRSAVDDSSAAASKSARLRLAGMLQDSKKNAYEGILLFNRDDVFNVSLGLRKVDSIFATQNFASLKSSDEFYGGGYTLAKLHNESCETCLPPWSDPEGYTKTTVWYDPIFDSAGDEAKYWQTGRTVPVVVGDESVGWKRSFHAISNETGAVVNKSNMEVVHSAFLVSWNIDVAVDIGLMKGTPYNGTWSPTYFWNSVDGSPYAYLTFTIRYDPPWAQGRYILMMTVWFMFRPWTSVIREFSTANTELVALDPWGDQVFAHTIYEGLAAVKPECFTACFICSDFAGKDCVMHPSDLGPTVHAAVNSSRPRKRGDFFTANLPSSSHRVHIQYGEYFDATDVNKTSPRYKRDYFVNSNMDGGEYFLRMTHFYTAGATNFELLWMRSVASVNDKVYAALVQLIIASVVIFAVDLIIAVLEIVLIARPLERLVVGNHFLETMELDAAEKHMRAMYKPIMVSEVARVTDGLLIAICCLREYKAYLPETLFVAASEDNNSSASSSSGSKRTEITASTIPRIAKSGNLSMQMQNYKGTVVKLSFIEELYTTFPENFECLMEVVHEMATATRGLSHGFSVLDPAVFSVTWNVGLRCTDSMVRAAAFCRGLSSSSKVVQIAVPVMAVAFGEFLAGNLGSATHKGFGLKGVALKELKGIMAVAEVVSVQLSRPSVLVSPQVAEGVTGRFRLSAFTLLRMPGAKRSFIVYEVGDRIEASEEEWMYQLQNANISDPIADALREVQVNSDARPIINKIKNPTPVQMWAIRNIREGRAVMTCPKPAIW
eukprot:TRINITY_DN8125_c0_g1_i2.p1 TRINITY_DN8125_c0_g1~~TRINITY_DN8125_c0_g1_i2.p1  ORF type:complete len:821 (+),score=123.33 TRINITY_DN8125_c0_g1_i2:40-2463(+)